MGDNDGVTTGDHDNDGNIGNVTAGDNDGVAAGDNDVDDNNETMTVVTTRVTVGR